MVHLNRSERQENFGVKGSRRSSREEESETICLLILQKVWSFLYRNDTGTGRGGKRRILKISRLASSTTQRRTTYTRVAMISVRENLYSKGKCFLKKKDKRKQLCVNEWESERNQGGSNEWDD